MEKNDDEYKDKKSQSDVGIQCCDSQILNLVHDEGTGLKPKSNCMKCPNRIMEENASSILCSLSNGIKMVKNECDVLKNDNKSGKRKRRTASLSPVCPVCGLTLRNREIKEHYEKEIKLLNDLNDPSSKSTIKWLKRFNATRNKKGNNSAASEKPSENEKEELSRMETSKKRQEEYWRIRNARRSRHAKLLLVTAPRLAQSEAGSSDCQMVQCPVCDAPIAGNDEELTHHVDRCLMKKEGVLDEDVSDEESVEEYTWAGQTRIRATSLLEGGLMVCGGDPIKLQMTNEDEELDIDGDMQIEFGLPQYTEKDVIPCSADIPSENVAQDCIRAAISVDQQSSNSKETSRSRWSSENGSCSNRTCDQTEFNEIDCEKDQASTVKDLKQKIENLNDELQKEKLKCLICMEGFNTPLVSVVCWHVYCEECWMRTLGAKKLCPQCNTITSPSDLRRIYI